MTPKTCPLFVPAPRTPTEIASLPRTAFGRGIRGRTLGEEALELENMLLMRIGLERQV